MRIKYTILICLLFTTLSTVAQQKKTEKTTISNPSNVGTEFPCTLEYDYTLVDSTKVVDGSYKINGQNTSKELKESYSLNAQANNDQLNGPISADYTLEGTLNGSKRFVVFSYTGEFQNGLPHGETKIKSFGQGSSAYDVSMNFNKGIPQGLFKFKAYVKKEIDIEGNFNSEGQLTGDWKFGRYDILAESADRNTITLLNGLKISGSGYTDELAAEARKFSEGKITEEELKRKGIIVNTSNNGDIEEIILGAIRSRFIPFDSMPSIDLSKINLTYRYLDYFPAVNEEGFNLLLADIDKYEGYTFPTYASFGITTNEEGKPIQKTYGKESESYIINSAWDENMLCKILFTQEQAQQLSSQISLTQDRWKKGAIAICKSNYEILIGQQLVGKSASEISSLMKNAIMRGYKVEMDHSAKRYEAYSPIVGFEAGELSASTDSSAVHKYTSIVHIENKDSVGYRTYEWTILIRSTDTVYICDNLNNSFTPRNFRRIRNDYDTINELLSVIYRNNKDFATIAKNTLENQFAKYTEHISKAIEIDHNDLTGTIEHLKFVLKFQEEFKAWLTKAAEIKAANKEINDSKNKFSDIKQSYEEYVKGTNLSWSPSNDMSELLKLEDVQKDVLFFIEGSCRLAENNKTIRNRGSKYKEMMSQYRKFIKHTELNWSIGGEMNQLDSILNVQERTLEYISKRDTIASYNTEITASSAERYPKLEKAYRKYFKQADFTWTEDVALDKLNSIIRVQDKTIKFLELRNKIVENDNIIHKKSIAYRNIRKAYDKYIDNADVSWTEDVDLVKLEIIIATQDSYIALLNRDDVKQINKSAGTDGIQL